MTKRTGNSLLKTTNTAPTALMVTVGFTPEQAARVIRVRRVLPLVEDRKAPCVDARKLWEKVGKPYGRFNAWADSCIKPLTKRLNPFTGISVKVTPVKVGRPRTDYTLSRDLAANLAMMANTVEGDDVRAYFLDMEDLASRLTAHLAIRVSAVVAIDSKVTHMFTQKAGDKVKAGELTKAQVRSAALEKEKLLKSFVCQVVTGQPTDYWRETFGRGVRDVLDTDDIQIYSQCYETACSLVKGGFPTRAAMLPVLTPSYGGRVNAVKYLPQR